ncbi:MAG: response regulator transcription factor [Gammaproteobacteria bacterium]|nr:response regulator transcription factor [Gammaproteobacteria bacterium]
MRVLVVEDDADTSLFIAQGLREFGHEVVVAHNGRTGLEKAMGDAFDVLIVDRMLPELDGLALVRSLRGENSTTPILMLTAVAGIADRVEGLNAGTDDYLVKPFALSELTARIHALARRTSGRADPHRLILGDIVLDLHRRTVERAGRRILLQPREFALLAELMRNSHRVMTRTMLLERVWDFDFDPKTNLVETLVSRLRSKLNEGFERDPIETVRGAGYIMRVD